MKKTSAFTLVELSIVLVIIGLIVGGVVGGQSLIASARINAQVQQLTKYETAYNAFKLQYDAIPGDMIDASDYWSNATNGNGDNKLSYDANTAYSLTRDNLSFFEHLSLAGLIPETFTNTWQLGVGYPELKISKGMGMIAANSILASGDDGDRWQLNDSTLSKTHIAALFLEVSQPQFSNTEYNNDIGTMSPKQAKTIDRKIDDGAARTGRYQSHQVTDSTVGWCLNGTEGDYRLSAENQSCVSIFILE